MAQEIYHRSEWGNPTEQWGNVYLNADLTNELYKRASEYENSWVTDQLLNGVGTKPSIILTPTAYEDGVLNSVKPAKTFGSEQIVNGSFDTDSDWTKGTGWTISGGTANCDGTQTSTTNLNNTLGNGLVNGKTYRVIYTISSYAGGSIRIKLGNTGYGVYHSSNGTYTQYLVAGVTTFPTAQFNADANFVGSIDNVSVKEVIDADFDFTRGSSATRVNELGLVQDVQLLSGELVQNGNFEQIGSELVTNGSFDTDTDWTKQTGWSISDGVANYDFTSDAKYIRQTLLNGGFVSGKTYRINFEITTGTAYMYINSNGGSLISLNTYSIGSYSLYTTASANGSDLLIYGRNTGGTAFSIDNVSVKEVGQNWTVTNDDANNYVEFNQEEGTVRLKFLNTSPLTTLTSDTQYSSGKKYKLTVDVKEVVSGAIKIDAAGVSELFNSVGIQERIIEPTGNANIGFYRATANVDITLNSVSLIEITDDTDLPRINYTNFDYEDVLGDELVTNGTFDSDSNWSKGTGWSIANGRASYDGSGLGYQFILQAITTTSGSTYQITFDVLSSTGSNLNIVDFGSVRVNQSHLTEGNYTFYAQADSSSENIIIYANGTDTFSIDNVSVKEITYDVVVPYSAEGSLLLEPQSTNLITYSEDFSQWSQVNLTNTNNEIISPDGTVNASLITEDATSSFKYTFQNLTVTLNQHTLSFFAKYKGRYLQVLFGSSDVSGNPYINFDLQNGTYDNNGVTNPSIEDYGNDWYKISLSITPTVTSDFGVIFSLIPSLTSARATSYQGNGTSGVYLWGAQLEQLSYATSYIPTNGSTVTRLADVCNNSGSSDLINSTEGVLYAEIAALADDGTNRSITISDGSTNNVVQILFSSVSNTIRCQIRVGGVGGDNLDKSTSSYTVTDFNKVALKWEQNNAQVWINGTQLGSPDTNSDVPIGLNDLSFEYLSIGNKFYGKCKCVAVFKEALSDTELQKLTTI